MLREPTRRDRDGESSGNRSLGSGSGRASGTFVSKPRGCPDPRLEFSLYVLSGSRRTRRAPFAGRPRYDTITCGGQKSGKYTNRTLLFIDCSAQQAWGQGVELLRCRICPGSWVHVGQVEDDQSPVSRYRTDIRATAEPACRLSPKYFACHGPLPRPRLTGGSRLRRVALQRMKTKSSTVDECWRLLR